MNVLKSIIAYLFWILIALLGSLAHMYIVLGPKPAPSKSFMKLFDWGYDYAMIFVGSIIWGIISLLYILFNVFYLKKKLRNDLKSIAIRFLVIIIITVVVGTTHYVLEKVIDVI